jgi:hypothetical protein
MDGADRSFRTSSWLFARALGVVLAIAFISVGVQATGLFGERGVVPIADFVASAKAAGHHLGQHPSLFWFFSSDSAITLCWVAGLGAALLLVLGFVPKLAIAVAWLTYLSFVTVGWPFMSFQWDTLLLEATFTAWFFVPFQPFDRLSAHPEPHPVARWALWWLLFRLVFRSAYVKLASGDPSWANLSALDFHYWTQPLPTAVGWYAHLLPGWFNRLCCLAMFIVEFGAPLLIGVPRPWARRSAAAAIAVLMALIGFTGNYGFFNLLTIVLCIPLLDDRLLRRLPWLRTDLGVHRSAARTTARGRAAGFGPALVIALSAAMFFAGTFGERPPRWLGPIYPLSTFNNYGLFSVMTTERREIEIEGTRDGQNWIPYIFAYKPGPLERRPVWVAPHQPRLDWQMWFAALGDYRRNPWLASLVRRLLEGDPHVLSLFGENPFGGDPPKQIRAVIYRYRPTSASERATTGRWWNRDERALYAPILGVPVDGQLTPVPPSPQ